MRIWLERGWDAAHFTARRIHTRTWTERDGVRNMVFTVRASCNSYARHGRPPCGVFFPHARGKPSFGCKRAHQQFSHALDGPSFVCISVAFSFDCERTNLPFNCKPAVSLAFAPPSLPLPPLREPSYRKLTPHTGCPVSKGMRGPVLR